MTSMPAVLVLQHTACETLGTIAEALEGHGLSPRYVRTQEGQPVPEGLGDAAGLIVMGGPMGVYAAAEFPFLRQEMRLMERALREGRPVLGVCLGSQLLAAVLGAPVSMGRQNEIGWRRVRLTEEAQSDPLWAGVEPAFTAFHWHGDVFPLPQGAVPLASSELTECQGFRYGRNAYGLLFHLEVTQAIIRDMVSTFREELGQAGIPEGEVLGGMGDHLPALHRTGGTVFNRWAGLAAPASSG